MIKVSSLSDWNWPRKPKPWHISFKGYSVAFLTGREMIQFWQESQVCCPEVAYASETESFPLCPVHDGGRAVIFNVSALSICGRWWIQATTVAIWTSLTQSEAWFQAVSSEHRLLLWTSTGVTQMVWLAAMICFHISWLLRGVSLICQSVVFQTADQIVKPLAIAQETGEI